MSDANVTHSREQQAQVIVDLGRSSDGRAIRAAGVLVRDGHGGRDAVDPLGRRLIELIEKLASVGREAFDVSPLALGVERVEGHARFSAARDAAKHDELAVGQVQIDLPQVVDCYAAQFDGTLGHVEGLS